jgi:hypothetical protein
LISFNINISPLSKKIKIFSKICNIKSNVIMIL